MGPKQLVILLFFLCSAPLYAQVPSDTVRTVGDLRIRERDARLGLTKALLEDDADSLRYWRDLHVVDKSRRTTRDRKLLDVKSRAILNFQIGDAHALLEDIRQGEHYFSSSAYSPLADVVLYRFVDVWALRTDLILDRVEAAAILPQERDLLMVYWMAAFNDLQSFSYGIGYSQQYINEQANLLLTTELGEVHQQFLRDHIRQEYEASPIDLGFSFTAGGIFFTPPLDQHIQPGMILNVRGEAFHSRLQIFAAYNWMRAVTSGPIQLDTLQLTGRDRLSWFNMSGGIGMVIFDTPRSRSIVSAGINAGQMSHRLADTTHTTRFFLGPIAELGFDIKLSRNRAIDPDWKGLRSEWDARKQGVHGLRLLFGYSHTAVSRQLEHQGAMVTLTIGYVGHYRQPMRRR